jgi:hypothetical protein
VVQAAQVFGVERQWVSGEHLPFLDDPLELRVRPVAGQKMVQAVRKDSWLDVWAPAGMPNNDPIRRVEAPKRGRPDNRRSNVGGSGRGLPSRGQQIELVGHAVILCISRIAAQRLRGTEQPIGRIRGRVHDFAGIPVVATYHPAYLLRSPGEKRKSWDDLKLALKALSDGHRA